MRPEDSGRGLARLPARDDGGARPRRRRRRSSLSASAPRRRARSRPIPRTRGSRSSASTACSAPMPRSARAISSRSARPNRSPRTRVVFAPGAAESAAAGLRPRAQAQLFGCSRSPPATSSPPPASSRSRAATCRPSCRAIAHARRPMRCRKSASSVISTAAQGHRPYRRQYRDRASPRI